MKNKDQDGLNFRLPALNLADKKNLVKERQNLSIKLSQFYQNILKKIEDLLKIIILLLLEDLQILVISPLGEMQFYIGSLGGDI